MVEEIKRAIDNNDNKKLNNSDKKKIRYFIDTY